MSPPLVTVIIPTYNWSTVLPYSIGSVLAQTLGNFELLVIGDCCTDDSEAVVNAIGDPRVRWINLPEHAGHQSTPNNHGLNEARGEFIAYLGHDDLWLPHHLECAVQTLNATGAALAYSLLGQVAPGSDFAVPNIPRPEIGFWTPPSSIVHRRSMTETVGGWKDYRDLTLTPEEELWRRANAAGHPFAFVRRLTAIKFAACERSDVYRVKPFHEQAAWLTRIRTEPAFEAEQLATMITRGDAARGMSARTLVPLLARELVKRFKSRLSATSRRAGLFRAKKGARIGALRSYKGL